MGLPCGAGLFGEDVDGVADDGIPDAVGSEDLDGMIASLAVPRACPDGAVVCCMASSAEASGPLASGGTVGASSSGESKALPQFLQNFASSGFSALQVSHDFIGVRSLVPLAVVLSERKCNEHISQMFAVSR